MNVIFRISLHLFVGLVCFVLASVPGCAQTSAGEPVAADYPLIMDLSPGDILFKQLSDSIAQSHAAEVFFGNTEARRVSFPDLVFFRYISHEDTDIFILAARVNIAYETIATLNRFANARIIKKGETIILPSVTGIFLPDDPLTDLEYLMDSWRRYQAVDAVPLVVALGGRTTAFTFSPGARFLPAERAFFLNVQFRFPLPKARMTSGFGYRPDPFNGGMQMHSGVDLAAPSGTEVMAARAGTVEALGFNHITGNYIILKHEGGWQTVYGHLSTTAVRLHETVKSGTIIGKVGSTGASTGPHLHFEVRLRGSPRDPAILLPRNRP